MGWTQGYDAKTGRARAEPVYMIVFPRFKGETLAAYDADDASFEMEPVSNFNWGVGDKCLVYDNSGWEFILPSSFTESTTDTLGGITRGVGGSAAQSFASASRVFNPHMILSTGTVSGCTLDYWPFLKMPSGHSCALLYQEGRTQTGGVSVEIIDKDNLVTKKFNNWVLNGKPAVILGGYADLPFYAYTVLYTGTVRNLSYRAGVFKVDIVADFDKLSQTLFGDLEDFEGTLTVDGAVVGDTTLNLEQATWPYDTGTCTDDTLAGYYAAIYFKVENELMRATSGSTVVRGELGTSEVDHGQHIKDEDGNDTGQKIPVDIMFSIQANPVDCLLYFLLSGNTSYSDQGTWDLYFGADEDDPIGVRWPVSSVDVAGFTAIRDAWYPSDVYRIDITKRMKMRELIEDNLLKPMNANLFIDRTGKLGLAALVPATPTTYSTLTEADIVGAPEIRLDAETLLNDVLVKWNYDPWDDEYIDELRLIDATSQSTYDKETPMVVEARGVHPLYGGETLARTVANNKLRNFKDLQATVSFTALFNKAAAIEPGSSVRLNHAQLPDTNTGTVGFDYYVFITSKRINWGTGAIEFEGIKTNFGVSNRRTALIAPTGTADYAAATQTVKDTYAFISDANGGMSNGDTRYAWS